MVRFPLTNSIFAAILPSDNAMTGRSSAAGPCQENPWAVERGEGGGVNTSLSSGPKAAASRLRRARPIQRTKSAVAGLHEAASREGTANQRWYRDQSPSVRFRLSAESLGQGVFLCSDRIRI